MPEAVYIVIAGLIVLFVIVLWLLPGRDSIGESAPAAPASRSEATSETLSAAASTPAAAAKASPAPVVDPIRPVPGAIKMPAPKVFRTAAIKPTPPVDAPHSPVAIPVPLAISAVFDRSAIAAMAESSPTAVAVAEPPAMTTTKALPTPRVLETLETPKVRATPDVLGATEAPAVPAAPAEEIPAAPEVTAAEPVEATVTLPAETPAVSETPSATPTVPSERPTWVSWSPSLPPPVEAPREIAWTGTTTSRPVARIAGFEVPAPDITMRQGLLIAAGMGLVVAIVRH